MGPINVVVQDANNLVLEVTPTAETSVVLDRGIAGPVGMVWKGNWSSTTLYIPNDTVFNAANNASYICIVQNTNQQPPNALYWNLLVAGFSGGDVNGPASATDNAVARFDGTTGKLIQNSNVTISDVGIVNIQSLTASKGVFTDASDNLTSTGILGVDQGGIGATTLADASIATYAGTETLTNKTISADNNTLSGIAASSFVLSNASGNIDGAAAQKAIPVGIVVGTTDTQTLTNKTFTAPTITGAILNDGYTEEIFAVTGTTPALSPTNASIQTWTLSGNSTPTSGTWNNGQSLTLMIDDGTAFTVTWTSLAVTWKTNSGFAPTLNTTGFTVIQLWKVGNIIYGARVGDA